MAITVPLFYLGVKHLRGGQQLPFVGKTLTNVVSSAWS